MKTGYTHITLILDRSGSMTDIRSDVIGGIKKFIQEQKEGPGECTLTLVQFDSMNNYEVIHDFKPIQEIGEDISAWYQPRGWTPLYDAVGKGIVQTGERLAALPEDQRPEKVVFVTMTDGQENHSTEFNAATVSKMTKEQTEQYNWKFVYLGADHDAVAAGASVGIARSSSAQYDKSKFFGAVQMTSAKVREYRTSGGVASALDFDDSDRQALS